MATGDIEKRFAYLANTLHAKRVESGWSRAALAERIGRSEEDMRLIESGKIKDELGTIYLICDELGLNFKELFKTADRDNVVVPSPKRAKQE